MASERVRRVPKPNTRFKQFIPIGARPEDYEEEEEEGAHSKRQRFHAPVPAVETFDECAAIGDQWIEPVPELSSVAEVVPGAPQDETHVTTKDLGCFEDDSETSLSQFADSDEEDDDTCNYCGENNDWKRLFQCSYCFEWIHLGCFNTKFRQTLKQVPEGNVACDGEENCIRKYRSMVEKGQVSDLHGMFLCAPLERGMPIEEEEEDATIFDQDYEDNDHVLLRSSLVNAKIKMQQIVRRQPMTFASMRNWTRTHTALAPELFRDILEETLAVFADARVEVPANIVNRLRGACPPRNIRRALAACGDGRIKQVRLSYKFPAKGVESYFVFAYRDPVEVAVDIYESILAKSRGPRWSLKAPRCSSGRMPDLKSKIEAFEATVQSGSEDGHPSLILPIGLYTDDSGSASRNVEFCPCWLTDLSMDPDVRFLEREHAHGLLGLFPVSSSIEYDFLPGTEGPASLAQTKLTKSQKYKALMELRKGALQEILSSIKRVEAEGKLFEIGGVMTRVRLLVVWYIADMKERRILLAMRKGVYDCTRCYAFPGYDNPKEISRGKRTSANDKTIRKEFERGYSSKIEDKEKPKNAVEGFKFEYGELGLTRKDECAFTDSEEAKIFTMAGPYELFNFDALHNKDGVIIYFVKFLEARFGDNFITETQRFGNVFLQTGKHSMHVMEKGIESFQFVPLAIMLGNYKNSVSAGETTQLFLAACDLLLILSLLTDPCPAYVCNRLEDAIKRFDTAVKRLLSDLREDEHVESRHKMTTKMHELTKHAVEQIKAAGLPSAFSSKLFEMLHLIIKELYVVSSKRIGDGSACKEIVLSMFYKMVAHEVELEKQTMKLVGIPPRSDWCPSPKFRIANNESNLKAAELMQRNMRIVHTIVFRGEEDTVFDVPTFAKNVKSFGSTLKMWIECNLRKLPASQESVVVVPGTSKGRYFHGGCFNALVFRRSKEDEESTGRVGGENQPDYRSCEREGCKSRHHDPDFQLFCSAARNDESAYGIPLLFFNGMVLMWAFKSLSADSCILPKHEMVMEVQCTSDSIIFIPFHEIRGVCVFRPCEDRVTQKVCYLFPARNLFGYNVEN